MISEKIGIIGAGKIGSAIARGIIRAGLVTIDRVMASDVSDPLRQAISNELGIGVTSDNRQLCDFANVVILAVKPQILDSVVKQMAKSLGTGKLLVSVAAGVPLSRIEAGLAPGARVVRVMPNICCVIGAGAAAYAGGVHATPLDLEIVGSILNSFGIGLAVEEKALADGGVKVGLSREVALKLALHTVYGAARMALDSAKHLSELKDEVTSPGGTTIAGLYALEQKSLKGVVMDAVVSATKRS